MNDKFSKPNRLVNESSPYLLQHAYNPVDWYPWCDEAFEKAVKEDKPIFLSIGYSTCHWCHVMEKESFEDQRTAKILNESFVPIKVDREERPDLDNIYMLVSQIMTGNGGWPLTLFLTPEKIPFYSGTYFPNVSRYGRIGFNELLNKINTVWKTNRNEMEETSAEIFTILNRSMSDIKPISIPENIFETAYKYFSKNYDSLFGGFGLSPKFPSPYNLIFLIRYWKYFNEPAAINIVNKTLKEMHHGGIFDQIGFGFHRYSTDSEWIIPHFEKMLYDQALITLVYSEAFQATKNLEFKIAAEQILDYVMREMTSPLGGFYSAEDADSDGEEGKYYFWTNVDLSACFNEEEKHFAMMVYNIGNGSEEQAKIPHLKNTVGEIANRLNIDTNTFLQKYENVRSKMFSYREKRMHPFKDDKILTDWNGLMIGSFANAGRIMNNSLYVSAAENAFHFIEKNLLINENKLLHRFRNGKKSIDANIDDYAFFVFSLLELYFTTYKAHYLTHAIELVNYIIEHFWDEEKFGFYFTPSYGEELITRTKDIYDAAIPSGNSMMLYNLSKLYRLTTDKRYYEYATKTVDAFSELLTKTPFASTLFLSSYLSLISESIEVIIIGSPDDKNVVKLLSSISSNYIPNLFIIIHNSESELYKLPFEYLGSYKRINESTTFYVCKNFTCNLPTTSVEEALKQIKKDYEVN